MTGNTEEKSIEYRTRTGQIPCVQSNVSSTVNKKNYCYICCKPQSKLARHLQGKSMKQQTWMLLGSWHFQNVQKNANKFWTN